MAGVVGSTNVSGTSYSLSASSPHFMNPVNTQTFATGDVVTDIDVYVFGSPTADTIFRVSLWELNAGAANGATLVWEKEVTIPNGATGSAWYNIPVSDEAISATNGGTLAVATASRSAGSGMTLRQGATGSSRSNAASGSTFVSPWVETTTTDRQLAVTVTTTAASVVTGTGAMSAQASAAAGTGNVVAPRRVIRPATILAAQSATVAGTGTVT